MASSNLIFVVGRGNYLAHKLISNLDIFIHQCCTHIFSVQIIFFSLTSSKSAINTINYHWKLNNFFKRNIDNNEKRNWIIHIVMLWWYNIVWYLLCESSEVFVTFCAKCNVKLWYREEVLLHMFNQIQIIKLFRLHTQWRKKKTLT